MSRVAGLGTEFGSGSVNLKPKVLISYRFLNKAKVYGDLGILDLINKPTEENTGDKIRIPSHHQYGSRN